MSSIRSTPRTRAKNPGKHPKIDRLLLLVLSGSHYTGRIVKRRREEVRGD